MKAGFLPNACKRWKNVPNSFPPVSLSFNEILQVFDPTKFSNLQSDLSKLMLKKMVHFFSACTAPGRKSAHKMAKENETWNKYTYTSKNAMPETRFQKQQPHFEKKIAKSNSVTNSHQKGEERSKITLQIYHWFLQKKKNKITRFSCMTFAFFPGVRNLATKINKNKTLANFVSLEKNKCHIRISSLKNRSCMNFWKKKHSYKILQILVFATQKVLLKWGNLQILYCDISKTKSCQILVPRKKIGKKKYVKFFAQGSCVKTKSGVAEIKRNFTNFAGWFQKKICFLSLP